MEALAKAKFQRFGRRKVAQVLDQIRGKSVLSAEQIADMLPRGCSTMVKKTVHSAAANLSIKLGRKTDPAVMWVTAAFADQGPMSQLRRVNAGPHGRAMPFKRKMCHLTVIVSDSKKGG